jgi:hypothetical protein
VFRHHDSCAIDREKMKSSITLLKPERKENIYRMLCVLYAQLAALVTWNSEMFTADSTRLTGRVPSSVDIRAIRTLPRPFGTATTSFDHVSIARW